MTNLDVDRRLVAILCADVAGYSRMIGEDEEGTLTALAAHMTELIGPAIDRHHGRIVKTTGDGFLAEFASPIAAALSALEIQEGLQSRNTGVPEPKRQWLRIGLTLGDVMVRDGDIFGDAVNVAARLQSLAEPGSVYASAAVVDQLRGHIGFAWKDVGEKALKNIARPVRAYRLAAGTTAAVPADAAQPRRLRLRLIVGAAAISAIAAIVAYTVLIPATLPITTPSTPPTAEPVPQAKPSIAVLPFVNQSGDPANDYFSDGVSEDIVNALGRFSALTVMAYNATLPYKGKAARLEDVGRKLGVRYLVEGSVRRAGNRVRVSTRLTDADQGILLWSERFEEQLKDVFALQDAITRRVAGTLAANLTRVEEQRALAEPPDNLDAYDLVLRGRAELRRNTRSGNREARLYFEKAMQLDPKYAAAYAGLGLAYQDMATLGWTEFPEDMLARSEELAGRALSLDPDNLDAHQLLSQVHTMQLQYDRALVEIDRALLLNPSDAASHSQRGAILLWAGRLEEAVAALETAFTLNPNLGPQEAFALGLAYYSLRRHDDAARFLEREALRNPDFIFFPVLLAATYGQLGRTADAERMAETVRHRLPVFDPQTFGSRFQNRAHHDYLIEGLRKAGLS
ncbi:adenylate cyclase [Ensifer sp. IC3342]|nr:adenylate cyclase [Ensifer sp. BRP08]MCA1450950.1 adenylate cyclase [Ensifer sp. IC3342]